MIVLKEVWRPIPGFEGFYSVSDHGNIRSETREVRHSARATKVFKGQPISQTFANGYLCVGLYKHGKVVFRSVHTLVMLAFKGPKPEKMQVAHFDGVRTNNRFSNLRYDTPKGNSADRVRHGTLVHGEKSHFARLSNEQVLKIRADTRSYSAIAQEYGVCINTVGGIFRKESWVLV